MCGGGQWRVWVGFRVLLQTKLRTYVILWCFRRKIRESESNYIFRTYYGKANTTTLIFCTNFQYSHRAKWKTIYKSAKFFACVKHINTQITSVSFTLYSHHWAHAWEILEIFTRELNVTSFWGRNRTSSRDTRVSVMWVHQDELNFVMG